MLLNAKMVVVKHVANARDVETCEETCEEMEGQELGKILLFHLGKLTKLLAGARPSSEGVRFRVLGRINGCCVHVKT